MKRKITAAAVAGSMLAGGAAGVGLFSGSGSNASAAGAASQPPATTAENPAAPDGHAFGGHNEATSDASVAAKAIGISEAALNAALAKGQTIAAVAKANSVDPQKVIDAFVADGLSELAADVQSGKITQAQADAEKTEVSKRATDQVNGTFGPGRPGYGGHNEATSDASVAAKAIGISEAALNAALAKGQTIAAVAKANSVDPQKVIDAFVADGLSELAADVQSGKITQAQADAEKTEVSKRATDQVNGTFGPDRRGAPDSGPPDANSGPTS